MKKATRMLENTLKWRRDFGVEQMHTHWMDTIALENSTGKTYVRGFDKEGHVILYMRPACENTNHHEGNMKHVVYSMERAVACAEKNGKEKISLIVDYNGFSLSNMPPLRSAHEVLTILQDHYPERLHRCICVQPPFIFWAFYNMIYPFIDSATHEKVYMVSSSDLSKEDCRYYQEFDKATLEVPLGGEDSRPFSSPHYLSAPFDEDYHTTLGKLDVPSPENT